MNIEIVQWGSGDWMKVYVNGDLYYAGHEMDSYEWEELLRQLGASVKRRCDEPDEDERK